ncbi:hypothetical protein Trydic_g9391 [Trypoxylus dichotomus]
MALEKSKSIEADLNLQMGYEIHDKRDQSLPGKETEAATLCQKAKWIFTNITVEPILICYVLPSLMASLAVQNLSLEKACRVNLAFDRKICDAMTIRNSSGYNISDEQAIQRAVATVNAYRNIVQSLIPSVLLIFLGSWSDRHNRRKPCIILPLFGEIVATTGYIICTYFFYELPMEFNVMSEAIPPALTGGWFCMFMGTFSYISGISSVETRTLRIGAANMFMNASISIGMALSGILYRKIGFYGVFSLAVTMYATGVLYALIRLKEIPAKDDNSNIEDIIINGEENQVKSKKKNFFADFFDPAHVSETLKVAFREGKRNRRKRICIIMVLVMVIIGPMHGTLFSLLFFSKFLKVDDAILGVISSASKIASSFVYAFAPTSTIFYLGAIVEMLNGTSFIAMRSITSKLVPPEELGKINSLFGVSEALMPLVYGPMYSFVYKSTIDTIPGSFLLLGGILTTPAIIIFLWLYKEHRQDAKDEAREKALDEKLLQQKQ